MGQLLAWILRSKGAKVGGGLAGGGAMVTLILALHQDMTEKIGTARADAKEFAKSYVDSRHDVLMKDIGQIKESQGEIKRMIRTLDNRIYRLKSIGQPESED